MVTLDAQDKRERKLAAGHVVLMVALAAAIFAFDVSLPLGVAGGVPYVALVLFGLWLPGRRAVIVLALAGTALTLLGYVVSPAGGIAWMVVANRGLAIFAIWVTAVLIVERRKADEALKQTLGELDHRVQTRTAELRDANQSLTHEVAEREQAEEALRKANDELETRVTARTAELLRVNERLRDEIVERERVQRELVEKSALLDGFIEHSRVIVSIKDPAGRYMFVNPEFERSYGVSCEQAKGKTVFDFIPKDMAALFRAHEERVVGERRAEVMEASAPHADGTLHTYLTAKFPVLNTEGTPIALGTIETDITEHKRLELQLDQAAKLATLGEMAAGLAHELNQPLHIIRMGADSALLLMEEGEANVDYHEEQFRIISGQAQRMAKITDHMQLFGRIDDGEPVRFDPADCVSGAIGMVGEQFRMDDVQISVKIPESCRPVLGRPVRLEQVMLNLLNNARDAILANPRPSTLARRARRKVDVKVVDDRRGKVIRISVIDNGGGIPEQVLGRMFEPFFTTKEVGKGTGLGLSISYGIIAEMGGTIEARNVRNKACFEITLPVCVEA